VFLGPRAAAGALAGREKVSRLKTPGEASRRMLRWLLHRLEAIAPARNKANVYHVGSEGLVQKPFSIAAAQNNGGFRAFLFQ
jgi:hypothetical protein